MRYKAAFPKLRLMEENEGRGEERERERETKRAGLFRKQLGNG